MAVMQYPASSQQDISYFSLNVKRSVAGIPSVETALFSLPGIRGEASVLVQFCKTTSSSGTGSAIAQVWYG